MKGTSCHQIRVHGLLARSVARRWMGILVLCLAFLKVQGQYSTPVQDGAISPGEYGLHVDGRNQQASSATTWYMTWDANNLYLGLSGSNISEAAVLYFDTDPVIPVNGGTDASGSNQGYYTYDRNHSYLPFRADFALYLKDSYHEFRRADAAGYWTGQTAFSLVTAVNGGSNTIEVAIPWSTLTNGGGRPDQFNWLGYKVYDYGPATNGVYHPVPTDNPACACNADPSRLYPGFYYNVLSTAPTAAVAPFAWKSFVQHQDNSAPGGGYYLRNQSLYDLTVNDNSPDNGDNDPANHVYDNQGPANRILVEDTIRIAHHLYVGTGSALLPADNVSGDVLATLHFTGENGRIYNFGRIDPNPEVSANGDWNRRRMDFLFNGTTRLMPSDLFKDRWRLSNVTILPGDSLLGPHSDSVSLELQWGTFLNQGALLLGEENGGYANLGLRGDWSQANDYGLSDPSGTGKWRVHDLLIGRNSSLLHPVVNGGQVRLEVGGDFENYDRFEGQASGGWIDVVMNGSKRQFLRGNVNETNGGETVFYRLEIDNADGSSLNNDAADVHFVSYGGGQVSYRVEGGLSLQSGDLVTRDRTTGLVHELVLAGQATVDASGARSNSGGQASSFVDGPLQWEIATDTVTTRMFPIGKSKAFTSYLWADYRPLSLEIDQDAASPTLYTAEMFIEDQSLAYTWPSPVPEPIVWISEQRYWRVEQGAGANLDSARITLVYGSDERHDGVTDPGGLRIVKDDGLGNWVNIAPGGPGGTAVGDGSISSQPFYGFSDFTLASVVLNQPLPVLWGSFEAQWEHPEYVNLDWKTLQEVNTDRFWVERSADGLFFEQVGEVRALGNSPGLASYSFQDRDLDPEVDSYHYRLRLLDLDGGEDWSSVRVVSKPSALLPVRIWPNPSTGWVEIMHPLLERVEICDLRGRVLGTLPVSQGQAGGALDLPTGLYLLRVSFGEKTQTHKLEIRR